MLTREAQQDAKLSAGVRINGARIVENINLENVKLICAIEITGSRIEGAITIRRSHTESVILLDGSLMNGEVNAYGLRSGSDLSFADGATFKGIVNLGDAKIDGKVDISGSRFEGKLNAEALRVGGTLDMSSNDKDKAGFKDGLIGGTFLLAEYAPCTISASRRLELYR